MDNHSLIEVANVLHRVCFAIIHGKYWLSKSSRKFSSFNSTRKRWFRNLVKSPAHSIIAQTLVGWTLASTFIVVILIIWKRLIGRSPGLGPVATISIIVRRRVKIWRSPSPSLAAQPSLQTVNLQLHASSILSMREVTPTSRLTPTNMPGVHTNLALLRSKLRNWSWRWEPTNSSQFGLEPTIVGHWTHQSSSFPQTAPIIWANFGF